MYHLNNLPSNVQFNFKVCLQYYIHRSCKISNQIFLVIKYLCLFVCCRTWGWKRLRSSPPLSSLWETITASSTHFSFPRNQLQHIFFFNYSTFAIIMFIAVYMVTVITSILVILLSFASSGDGDGETTDAEAMNQLASVVGGFVQVNL